MKILVLTISDRASEGVYEDRSGPAVEEVLEAGIPGARIKRLVIPDDEVEILQVFESNLDRDVIITTGGSGIGPRDVTPDVTERFCDALIPGIVEHMRRESYRETPYALLSRAVAGRKDRTVIVNLPGSVKGARFCAELLVEILPHACAMVRGEGH